MKLVQKMESGNYWLKILKKRIYEETDKFLRSLMTTKGD